MESSKFIINQSSRKSSKIKIFLEKNGGAYNKLCMHNNVYEKQKGTPFGG